jgi:hypothetical protein
MLRIVPGPSRGGFNFSCSQGSIAPRREELRADVLTQFSARRRVGYCVLRTPVGYCVLRTPVGYQNSGAAVA